MVRGHAKPMRQQQEKLKGLRIPDWIAAQCTAGMRPAGMMAYGDPVHRNIHEL
jgi:hypothetical protein